MKAADRLVEVAGKNQEGDQDTDLHFSREDLRATHPEDDDHSSGAEEIHRGAVDRPDAHHH